MRARRSSTRTVSLPAPTFLLDAGHGLDVTVFVRRTAQAFRRLARVVESGRPVPRRLVGACWGAVGPGSTPDRRSVALVVLAQPLLGSGYVTHELAHATYRVLEARRLKVRHWAPGRGSFVLRAKGPEEQYCLTLERLCAGFWREAYARKLA